jgi:hypothetical protein
MQITPVASDPLQTQNIFSAVLGRKNRPTPISAPVIDSRIFSHAEDGKVTVQPSQMWGNLEDSKLPWSLFLYDNRTDTSQKGLVRIKGQDVGGGQEFVSQPFSSFAKALIHFPVIRDSNFTLELITPGAEDTKTTNSSRLLHRYGLKSLMQAGLKAVNGKLSPVEFTKKDPEPTPSFLPQAVSPSSVMPDRIEPVQSSSSDLLPELIQNYFRDNIDPKQHFSSLAEAQQALDRMTKDGTLEKYQQQHDGLSPLGVFNLQLLAGFDSSAQGKYWSQRNNPTSGDQVGDNSSTAGNVSDPSKGSWTSVGSEASGATITSLKSDDTITPGGDFVRVDHDFSNPPLSDALDASAVERDLASGDFKNSATYQAMKDGTLPKYLQIDYQVELMMAMMKG